MDLQEKLYKLTQIGIALSREQNLRILLSKILQEARSFTMAEGGSLYIREQDKLVFAVSQNDLLSSRHDTLRCSAHRDIKIDISNQSIAGYAALTGKTINIKDAYNMPKNTPYNIDRSFDKKNKYQTSSMLVVPVQDVNKKPIAVIALINAKNEDGEIIPFSDAYESLISSLASQAAVCILNAQLHQQLKDAYLDTIFRLSRAAEYRDKETAFHLEKISNYSAVLADELGFGMEYIDHIRYASPMHDIGKIGIADAILLKPGKLTPLEFEEMKKHTIYGAEILSNPASEILKLSAEIALTHHEKHDGTGYPKGLKGNEIPWSGKIVAVADVFDALTSKRCYKEAWDVEAATKYIKELTDKQFDPQVVEAFERAQERILEVKSTYDDHNT